MKYSVQLSPAALRVAQLIRDRISGEVFSRFSRQHTTINANIEANSQSLTNTVIDFMVICESIALLWKEIPAEVQAELYKVREKADELAPTLDHPEPVGFDRPRAK